MVITTSVLDKAAFLLSFRGVLIEIKGTYPDNEYVISCNRFIALYETIGGLVPYRNFCNKRRYLKRKARKQAGLPQYFTGDIDSHFTFRDLARISLLQK